MVDIPYTYLCSCNKRVYDTFMACRYNNRDRIGRPYHCNTCRCYHWTSSTKSQGRRSHTPPGRVLLTTTSRWRYVLSHPIKWRTVGA